MKINRVIAIKAQPQPRMIEADAGGKAIAEISLMNDPIRVARPGDLPLTTERVAAQRGGYIALNGRFQAGHIRVNAKAARACAGMIFLPHMREIDIPDLIAVVEGDEQSPVPNRNIAWHATSFTQTKKRTYCPVHLIGLNRPDS